MSNKYKIYVTINSNIEARVLAKIRYVQTVFKSFEGKKYIKAQVRRIWRHIVKILAVDVLDTLLTPVKYPLSEVITDVNGIAIAII